MVLENVDRALTLQAVVRYIWWAVHAKEECRRAVLDALISKFGCIMVAFDPDAEKREGNDPAIERYTSEEGFQIKRISPLEIYGDWTARSLKETPWVIHRVVRPLDEVREDPRLEHTDELKATASLTEDPKMQEQVASWLQDEAGLSFEARQRRDWDGAVELFDIIDKERIRTISPGVRRWLRNDPNPYKFEGLPFCFLELVQVPDRIYGRSPLQIIETMSQAQDKLLNVLIEGVKRSLPKIAADRGSLDQKEIEALIEPTLRALVEIDKRDPNVPWDQIIHELDLNFNPRPLLACMSDLETRMQKAVGLPSFRQGIGSERRESATMTALRERGAGTRQRMMQDLVEDWTQEIAEKLVALIKDFGPTRVALVRMMDQTGQRPAEPARWVRWSRSEIQGQYDVRVEPGSIREPNVDVRQKRIVELLAILTKLPNVNWEAVAQWVQDAFEGAPPNLFLPSGAGPGGTPVPHGPVPATGSPGPMPRGGETIKAPPAVAGRVYGEVLGQR